MELRHALIITLNISKIDLGGSLSQATISCQYCLLTGYSANLSLKHDMHLTDYLQYDWGCLPALYESVYLNLLRQMRFFYLWVWHNESGENKDCFVASHEFVVLFVCFFFFYSKFIYFNFSRSIILVNSLW